MTTYLGWFFFLVVVMVLYRLITELISALLDLYMPTRSGEFGRITERLGKSEAEREELLNEFHRLQDQVRPFTRYLDVLEYGTTAVTRQDTFFQIIEKCLLELLQDPESAEAFIAMLNDALEQARASRVLTDEDEITEYLDKMYKPDNPATCGVQEGDLKKHEEGEL